MDENDSDAEAPIFKRSAYYGTFTIQDSDSDTHAHHDATSSKAAADKDAPNVYMTKTKEADTRPAHSAGRVALEGHRHAAPSRAHDMQGQGSKPRPKSKGTEASSQPEHVAHQERSQESAPRGLQLMDIELQGAPLPILIYCGKQLKSSLPQKWLRVLATDQYSYTGCKRVVEYGSSVSCSKTFKGN